MNGNTDQNSRPYSWGEFYETLKTMKESGDEVKNETFERCSLLFAKLDKASNIQEVKDAVREAKLSETEINYINSPCLDGILISMNRGDTYCFANKESPFIVPIIQGNRLETFKYYISQGMVKSQQHFYVGGIPGGSAYENVSLLAFICWYLRFDMIKFLCTCPNTDYSHSFMILNSLLVYFKGRSYLEKERELTEECKKIILEHCKDESILQTKEMTIWSTGCATL